MVKHVYLGKKDKVVTHVTIVAMGTNTPRSGGAALWRDGNDENVRVKNRVTTEVQV